MLTPEQFPLIIAAASEREAQWFAKALESLQRYEDEGLVQKGEFADLKSTFNRAFDKSWSKHMREPFLNAGRWENLSEAEYKFESAMGYPQCHTAVGMMKRLQHKNAPQGAMLHAMISVLEECMPIAKRTTELKDKIGKRAPAMTRTRQAEIDREAKSMTCQICGRGILAETGVIAHHGYERPGDGYQTASCPGARELPFEADRAALGLYIEALKASKASAEEALVRVTEETTALVWKYDDHSIPRKRWEPQATKTVIVTRETWAEHHAEAMGTGQAGLLRNVTFDNLKSAKMGELRQKIKYLGDAIVQQTKRFDAWVKTRDWDGEGWVPTFHLEPAPIIGVQIVAEDDWQFS